MLYIIYVLVIMISCTLKILFEILLILAIVISLQTIIYQTTGVSIVNRLYKMIYDDMIIINELSNEKNINYCLVN